MTRSVHFLLSLSLALGLAAPAAAQLRDSTEATAAELQAAFQRQKSRGLKLAPGTGVAPVAALPEAAVPGGDTAVATAPVAPDGTSLAAAAAGAAVAVTPSGGTTVAAAPVSPSAGGTVVSAAPVAPSGGTTVAAVAAPTAAGVVAAQGVTSAATAAGDAPVLVPVAYTEIDEADQVNIRVGFDFDSAVLREGEKAKLEQLCIAMKAVDIELFRIVGHTDAAGSDDYNDKLSLLRAEEVKRHLVSDCGIPPERLQAVGVGKRFLSNPEDPRGEENRRVEFQALS